MKKGIIGVLIIGLIASLGISGCSWVGRTAGKAQAKLERKANDLEEGYHQGYGDEKRQESSDEQNKQPTAPAGNAV